MTTVTIVYPTDPFGIVPGGTDTCIRDILRCAPDDIKMQLVGVTTNPAKYPVGHWKECEINGKSFLFFPLMDVRGLEKQMRIPLSAKFTLRLFGKKIFKDTDVVQFNRIEPALVMLGSRMAKIIILHQNMKVLENKNSDIRWKYLPGLYFWIESFIIRRLQEVFIVKEDAVKEYKERFPEKIDNIHFLPTWMNPALFYPLSSTEKHKNRETIFKRDGLPVDEKMMIFVGRFDHQKDPILLIDSVAKVFVKQCSGHLILIGDGILRDDIEERIRHHGIEDRVHLRGALPQDEVAQYLRASDLLLLSSVYEGMPRCVVEALGCGVPVVSTDAGEVALLIFNDINGYIVEERLPDIFSTAITKALDRLDVLTGQPCVDAVKPYQADVVLKKLYETYRHCACVFGKRA